MTRVTRDAVIQRPPAAVFRALVEPRERRQWLTAMEEQPLAGGATALEPGTRIDAKRRGSTSGSRYVMTVTALDPDRRLSMDVARNGTRVATTTFELLPEGAGATRVRAAGELHLSGLQRMMAPALAAATEKQLGEELAALKRHVEGKP